MSNNKQCQFEASRQTSSATICKWCGREKWQHNTTMSNKQSSIEWLEDKLNNVKPNQFCSIETIKKWVEQAKEMEKEQIIHAYNQSWHFRDKPYETAEKYYNETFCKII